MSHALQTTKALVIKHFGKGEADRIYHLYTEEFGRVDATAAGIRLLKSKLRYALQTHSFALVSLVEGRREWRIVNALPLFHLDSTPLSFAKKSLVSLLDRLIQGEAKDEVLFQGIERVFTYETLQKEKEDEKKLYIYGALFMLYHLGYYAPSTVREKELFESEELTCSVLSEFSGLVPNATTIIRDLLNKSHL